MPKRISLGSVIKTERYKLLYLFAMLCFSFFIVHHYRDYTTLKGIVLVYLLLVALAFFVCYKYREDVKKNLHKVYFFLGTIFGLMYIVTIPVYCVPDEQVHYWATYNISNELLGIGVSDNDTLLMRADDFALPVYVENRTVSEFDSYLTDGIKNIRATDTTLVDSGYEYTASISYCYFISALGLTLGRLLGLGSVYVFLLGRFFNLCIFMLGMAYAIKRTPIAKMGFFALGLFPIVLQEAASYSHDMLINLLSFLFISMTLDFYAREREDRKLPELILYGVILALLVPLKGYSYFLFMLFPLVICWKDYKAEKARGETVGKKITENKIWKSKIWKNRMLLPLAVTVVYNILLVIYRHLGFAKSTSVTSGSLFGEHIIDWCNEPGYSIRTFIENPYLPFRILYKTVKEYFGEYWMDAIGHQLGWRNIDIPPYLTFIWMFLAAIMFMKRKEEVSLISCRMKVLFTGISICVMGIVLMGLLFSWTPMVYDFIVGVQGRYFLPVIPLIFLVFRTEKIEISEQYDKNLVDFTVFVSAMVIFSVYTKF